jgi:hypothetical protein
VLLFARFFELLSGMQRNYRSALAAPSATLAFNALKMGLGLIAKICVAVSHSVTP